MVSMKLLLITGSLDLTTNTAKMPPKKGPVLLSSLDEYFGEEFGQKF